MPRLSKKIIYRCPFPGCKNKHVTTAVELSDYPQCNTTHRKIMDFIEKESTEVPAHILKSKQKSVSRYGEDRKVNGGNWVRD